MAKFSPDDLVTLLLALSAILLLSRFASELGKKIGLPVVMGELLMGIALGPTVLGHLSPSLYNELFPFATNANVSIALESLFSLAVILLLFVAGLEIQLSQVIRQGRITLYAGFGGMLLPFVTGFALAWFAPHWFNSELASRGIFALFLGTAMSISALPVIARILLELKLFKTEVGTVIISSAILNDLVCWLFFSFILSLVGQGKEVASIGETLAYMCAFSLFMLIVGRFLINRLLPWIQTSLSWPGGVLSLSLGLCLLCASFTEKIHLHAILGAFIAGIAIGDSVYLREEARVIMHQFVTNFFAPLFFVSIGLQVDFIKHFDWVIVGIVVVVAFLGKVLGAGAGAMVGGMGWRHAAAVGFGLNARGAMEILLGSLAYQAGLITQPVFVALVVMALVTSITSAPFIRFFTKGMNKPA